MWLSEKFLRDCQFDFDLEDIMVMEAIWLSIQVICSINNVESILHFCTYDKPFNSFLFDQEPGMQRNTSPDEMPEQDHNVEPSTPSSSSPSGGLACAIAVLAERQQMVGGSSSNQNINMVPSNPNNSDYNAVEEDSNHYLQGAGISYARSDMTDDSANEVSREVTWQ